MRWAGEWEDVQRMMDELVDVCVVCWAMGSMEPEAWASHWTRDCKAHVGLTGDELNAFRHYIRYDKDSHSCMKCGIS